YSRKKKEWWQTNVEKCRSHHKNIVLKDAVNFPSGKITARARLRSFILFSLISENRMKTMPASAPRCF
ncbi:MAG: hypothetical protein WC435_01670, partial [Candidatus Paceibacterota bacterium]